MEDVTLLVTENLGLPGVRVEIVDGCFVYRFKADSITKDTLRNIIRFINTLQIKFPKVRLPIVFELGSVTFADKLTYIVFECLCYYLIETQQYRVKIKMKAKTHIHTAGILSSPLMLLTNGDDESLKKFKEVFRFEIYHNHYRRVITKENLEKPDFLCKIMDDVACFQNAYNVNGDCREDIAEVIIELIGNASEHGGSNCLIDFDIAPEYRKIGSDKRFVGINIAIVNFSDKLLGTALKEIIHTEDNTDERYIAVRKAYNNHVRFFDDGYFEDDFYNLAAFQHKISGRHTNIVTGGTGLTKLIESLESRSDAHMCYVMSGTRSMKFVSDYLKYNEDKWLGFNKENDFLNTKPDASVFGDIRYRFPGTAYNLNFVLQRED